MDGASRMPYTLTACAFAVEARIQAHTPRASRPLQGGRKRGPGARPMPRTSCRRGAARLSRAKDVGEARGGDGRCDGEWLGLLRLWHGLGILRGADSEEGVSR